MVNFIFSSRYYSAMERMKTIRSVFFIKSFISYHFRQFFTFIYPLFRHQRWIIGTPMYEAKLLSEIEKIVHGKFDYFSSGKDLPRGYGFGFSERIVELPWFFSRLPLRHGIHLDAGSSINFEVLLQAKKLQNKKVFIANLNPERNCYWNKSISYYYWDLRHPLVVDNFFDSISCISVLEHIGMDNSGWTGQGKDKEKNGSDFLTVIRDFRRILKAGGNCYISVPYGSHRNYGWLQIFDKKMVNQIIRSFRPKSFRLTYFIYTKEGWQVTDEVRCKQSDYSSGYSSPDYCVGAKSVVAIHLVK